jgi:hypothetical protein
MYAKVLQDSDEAQYRTANNCRSAPIVWTNSAPSERYMQMLNHYHERWEGPIRGLRLPLAAWNRLMDEGITTIDELKAAADRLERIPRIGSKTARLIREEIARISAPEERSSD